MMAGFPMTKTFGAVSAALLLILCSCQTKDIPPTVTGKLEKAWQTGFASGYHASLIGNLFVVPSGADIFAIDATDGQVKWKYESPRKKTWNSVSCQEFGDGILASFESGAGSLIANLTINGTQIETFENERQSSIPTIFGPRFWQIQTNQIFGNVRQFTVEPTLPMAVSTQSLIITVSQANIIRAYNYYGKIVWYKEAYEDVQRISIANGLLFVYLTNRLLVFEADMGKFIWSMDALVTVDPKPFGKNLLFATNNGLIEVEPEKGVIQHSMKKDGIISFDVAPDGIVLLANAKIETYDLKFTKLDSIDAFDGTHQIIIGPGMIYANGTVGQTGYSLKK